MIQYVHSCTQVLTTLKGEQPIEKSCDILWYITCTLTCAFAHIPLIFAAFCSICADCLCSACASVHFCSCLHITLSKSCTQLSFNYCKCKERKMSQSHSMADSGFMIHISVPMHRFKTQKGLTLRVADVQAFSCEASTSSGPTFHVESSSLTEQLTWHLPPKMAPDELHMFKHVQAFFPFSLFPFFPS